LLAISGITFSALLGGSHSRRDQRRLHLVADFPTTNLLPVNTIDETNPQAYPRLAHHLTRWAWSPQPAAGWLRSAVLVRDRRGGSFASPSCQSPGGFAPVIAGNLTLPYLGSEWHLPSARKSPPPSGTLSLFLQVFVPAVHVYARTSPFPDGCSPTCAARYPTAVHLETIWVLPRRSPGCMASATRSSRLLRGCCCFRLVDWAETKVTGSVSSLYRPA